MQNDFHRLGALGGCKASIAVYAVTLRRHALALRGTRAAFSDVPPADRAPATALCLHDGVTPHRQLRDNCLFISPFHPQTHPRRLGPSFHPHLGFDFLNFQCLETRSHIKRFSRLPKLKT